MYKHANPLFLICETPLHAGSGSDLGIVDLPIQRERHTSFPKIEGSSLKGALREAFESKILNQLQKNTNGEWSNKNEIKKELKKLNKVFGYDEAPLIGFSKEEMDKLLPDNEKEFSGCLGISDARLFLFPVKSMKGVFAWITCPKVLRQFEMDIKGYFTPFNINGIPSSIGDNECYTQGKGLLINDKYVILEEYTFENKSLKEKITINDCSLGEWLVNNGIVQANNYWEEKIKSSIVILSDDAFKDFVNLSTEVITRNKINNITGTAADTGLFTEEYLPAESILYSMILAAPEFKKDGLSACEVVDFFTKIPNVVQIGGSATLGKGITRTQFLTVVSDKECKQQNEGNNG